MIKPVFPNTFIIGVQKAGTTSLDDWLSQHTEIYCYDSLKDVHLFGVYNKEEIEKKLLQEPASYNNEPVILQSAVNYIFYPFLLECIREYSPVAKLIIILRNPVDRAISAYTYFKKMLREKRPIEEALLYTPEYITEFSKENNDFTYIEHGLYYRQISECLKIFSRDQLLVLDYEELKQPETLSSKIFSFLNIDPSFKPDFSPKNITGEIKNAWLQEKLIQKSSLKKFLVKYLLDFWMPRSKRKLLKKKVFEINTSKSNNAGNDASFEETQAVKESLEQYFIDDIRLLDNLLNTDFFGKWFAKRWQSVKFDQ